MKRFSGKPRGRPRSDVQLARQEFIFALNRIAQRRIPGNPWQRLKDETWPEWNRTFHPTTPPGRRRYVTENERLQLDALLAARQGVSASSKKKLLRAWAESCGLGSEDAGKFTPAQWLMTTAEQLCEGWSAGSVGMVALSEGNSPSEQVANPLGQPKYLPPLNCIPVPIDFPNGSDRGAWKTFRKRVRATVTQWLNNAQREHQAPPDPTLERCREGQNTTDHFDWLVLYQCCGWKLTDIGASYHLPHQAIESFAPTIATALKRKAKLIGITVRKRH